MRAERQTIFSSSFITPRSSSLLRSPTDALISFIARAPCKQTNEINDRLVGALELFDRAKLFRLVADEQHVGGGDYFGNARAHQLRDVRLLGNTDASNGASTSNSFALYESARKSFGKHEPPKAKPGFK